MRTRLTIGRSDSTSVMSIGVVSSVRWSPGTRHRMGGLSSSSRDGGGGVGHYRFIWYVGNSAPRGPWSDQEWAFFNASIGPCAARGHPPQPPFLIPSYGDFTTV